MPPVDEIPASTPDPLHTEWPSDGRDVTWTLTNFSEAIPGVPTPLGWTFWHLAMERATRRTFYDLGAYPRSRVKPDPAPPDRLTGIFYGRAAGSVDRFRELAASMPGSSPEGLEKQIFGSVRPGLDNSNNVRRYPFAMMRAPLALSRIKRRLARVRVETDEWWSRSVTDPPRTDAGARALLVESNGRFQRAMTVHTLTTLIAQGAFEQTAALAAKAGKPGLETTLVTGSGSLEEVSVVVDLWSVSRGRLDMAEFLRRHGFHGPDEGEISSRSWREDPRPLHPLLSTYAAKPDDEHPDEMFRRQREKRDAAEREVLSALPAVRRVPARMVLGMARTLLVRREVGKAAFLQAVDVGRLAARIVGESFPEPDDVFYYTLDELGSGVEADSDTTAFRRARREAYREMRLPDVWTGVPTPGRADNVESARPGEIVEGIPVSPGIVEGRVRLITEAGDETEPLEPGDILVCRTTDPSWVAVFLTASALVIDVGGAISHGAIVARELGIPCVINTLCGTQRLRDGQRVRVDGHKGSVEVLA